MWIQFWVTTETCETVWIIIQETTKNLHKYPLLMCCFPPSFHCPVVAFSFWPQLASYLPWATNPEPEISGGFSSSVPKLYQQLLRVSLCGLPSAQAGQECVQPANSSLLKAPFPCGRPAARCAAREVAQWRPLPAALLPPSSHGRAGLPLPASQGRTTKPLLPAAASATGQASEKPQH